MIKRLILVSLLALTACPRGIGGPIDWYGYSNKWQNFGSPPPRCADELHAVAVSMAPCGKGAPRYGYIFWKPAPFMCDGRMVDGCSTGWAEWVTAEVAVPTTGYAPDSAQAEEIAHWVWPRCFPGVLTEWEEPDPKTGRMIFKRDPAFRAWYDAVNKETRAQCP